MEIWKDEKNQKSFKPGTSKFEKWYGSSLRKKKSYNKVYTHEGKSTDVAPHPDLSSPQSQRKDYGVIRMSKTPTSYDRSETVRKGRTSSQKTYSTKVNRSGNNFESSVSSSNITQKDIGPYSRNVATFQKSTPKGVKDAGQIVSFEPEAVDVQSTHTQKKRRTIKGIKKRMMNI